MTRLLAAEEAAREQEESDAATQADFLPGPRKDPALSTTRVSSRASEACELMMKAFNDRRKAVSEELTEAKAAFQEAGLEKGI